MHNALTINESSSLGFRTSCIEHRTSKMTSDLRSAYISLRGDSMHIRQGDVRDWPFIYALSKEVIPTSISPWRLQPMGETIKYRDKILKGFWSWIQQTDSRVFIAEEIDEKDTTKLGYLILYPGAIEELTGLKQAWVMDFAVLSSYRGHGTGKALLEAAEKYCSNSGIVYLGLAVSSHNNKALHLYERVGFAEERKLMVKVIKKQ